METKLLSEFNRDGVKLIRYADDFVVMAKELKNILKAKKILVEFLGEIGLELSEEKTRIGHSMYVIKVDGEKTHLKPGFDFLGYNFRNYPVSKHRGVKSTRGKTNQFIQISSPSLESVRLHKKEIKAILRKHCTAPREAIISKLSARIQGWTRYHAITKCSRYFSNLDYWLFKVL